ncbi:unnamed protein product, partial [Closterium sp. NIES-54]
LVKAAEDEGVEAEEQQQFQSLVSSLLYAAVHTRPDISFSVGQLARVVKNPSEKQVDAAERMVKYLNSHPRIGVEYSASAQVKQKGVELPLNALLLEPGRRFSSKELTTPVCCTGSPSLKRNAVSSLSNINVATTEVGACSSFNTVHAFGPQSTSGSRCMTW